MQVITQNTFTDQAIGDLVLDRVLNPTNNPDLNKSRPMDLLQACGIVPDIFADACVVSDTPLVMAVPNIDADSTQLDAVASVMDSIYGCGGFGVHPWDGEVLADGHYRSSAQNDPDDIDPDLPPLARFTYVAGGLECFVYEYSIISIRDTNTGQAKVARFD
tara:strand:+ start:75 stop:557 length:483 start_codon:yes stop_codon:yes gene_type:complete